LRNKIIGLGFEDCNDEINKIANKSVTFADNIKAAMFPLFSDILN
jgi:uncharacterized Fe-S cluster-containing MiaB family protein